MAGNHFDTILAAFESHNSINPGRIFSPDASTLYASSKRGQLQAAFRPSDFSVVCGRGKASFNHIGNRRFRILATIFIERYSQCHDKISKSAIVSEIIGVIRQAGGNFCKYEKTLGAWFEVGDEHAREKVSALLRDFLHTQYRSSAKAKIGRRKSSLKQNQHRNQQQAVESLVEGAEDSDDCSTTSSCWESSLGFEYWLEDSDDFFDIEVF
jgi:hypothetical protein